MAKTPWWRCNRCGFSNHPRNPSMHGGNEAINDFCEQCGQGKDGTVPSLGRVVVDPGIDYKPEAVA